MTDNTTITFSHATDKVDVMMLAKQRTDEIYQDYMKGFITETECAMQTIDVWCVFVAQDKPKQ